MQRKKKKGMNINELAKSWGIDPQLVRMKAECIDLIREHCKKNHISQRSLAAMVPGLTQDRVWKIFSGQVGHMSLDKLIEILSTIGYKVKFQALVA